MRQKMAKQMQQWSPIDNAFKKINTSTGVNDVQILVEKFLNKEKTYSDLLVTVANSESRIDKLKIENEELRNKLHELKIGFESGSGESETIKNLEKEQERFEKETDLKKEKYYNVEIITDIITGWAKRVVTKVDDNFTEEKASDTDIVDLFGHIADRVCESLSQLQDEPV
jgi:predicted nuclease with TOPRIM domain